jgi:hypothetical protein
LKNRTKPTINKEFKIPNHVAGTSVDSAAYSLPTFHITIPHIMTKLEDKIRFLEHTFESLFKQFDQNISNNNQRYYCQ